MEMGFHAHSWLHHGSVSHDDGGVARTSKRPQHWSARNLQMGCRSRWQCPAVEAFWHHAIQRSKQAKEKEVFEALDAKDGAGYHRANLQKQVEASAFSRQKDVLRRLHQA